MRPTQPTSFSFAALALCLLPALSPADQHASVPVQLESGKQPDSARVSSSALSGSRYLFASLQDNASAVTAGDVVEQSTFRPILASDTPSAFAVGDKGKPVKVKIYPMFDKLPKGGECIIAIELDIKRGWHINANPSSPDFLVPTKVEIKTKQKLKLTRVKYPKHHQLKVKGSPEPYHVYDGTARIYGLVKIDAEETSKFAELEFHVAFQGCNSDQCLPPDKIVMKGKLPLAAKGEQIKKINESKFPKPKAKPKAK